MKIHKYVNYNPIYKTNIKNLNSYFKKQNTKSVLKGDLSYLKEYTCSICNNKISKILYIYENDYIICPDCIDKFLKDNNYRGDVVKYYVQRYACSLCNNLISDNLYTYHKDNYIHYICPYCINDFLKDAKEQKMIVADTLVGCMLYDLGRLIKKTLMIGAIIAAVLLVLSTL